MNAEECKKLMDSLTDEQRKGIAAIIRGSDIEGDYIMGDDGGSHWEESTERTLEVLARYFEMYDPASVLP